MAELQNIMRGPHYNKLLEHAQGAMPAYYYTCPDGWIPGDHPTHGVIIKNAKGEFCNPDPQQLPSFEEVKKLVGTLEAATLAINNMLPGMTSPLVQEARDTQDYLKTHGKNMNVELVDVEYQDKLESLAPSVDFQAVARCASANEEGDNDEIASKCAVDSKCQTVENKGAVACVPKQFTKMAQSSDNPTSQSVAQWWQNYRRARVEA